MSTQLLTTLISATSIIVGSLVGAFCSYIISKKMHDVERKEEDEILKNNRRLEFLNRAKTTLENINIIRLDISTSIFQGIRCIQNDKEAKKYLYLLPINKNYSISIATLSDKFSLRELSDLYQLYAIMEKVNMTIYSWREGDDKTYNEAKMGFISILYKLYGKNYEKILLLDMDKVSYSELIKNKYIKEEYKLILGKLEDNCNLENLFTEYDEHNVN